MFEMKCLCTTFGAVSGKKEIKNASIGLGVVPRPVEAFGFYRVLQNLLSPARYQITGLKSKCYFSLLCGIILGGLADQLLDENSGRCQPATRAVNTNPNVFQLPLRDADVADWLNGFTWFSGMPLTRSCL